jgi:hypothetical protein
MSLRWGARMVRAHPHRPFVCVSVGWVGAGREGVHGGPLLLRGPHSRWVGLVFLMFIINRPTTCMKLTSVIPHLPHTTHRSRDAHGRHVYQPAFELGHLLITLHVRLRHYHTFIRPRRCELLRLLRRARRLARSRVSACSHVVCHLAPRASRLSTARRHTRMCMYSHAHVGSRRSSCTATLAKPRRWSGRRRTP